LLQVCNNLSPIVQVCVIILLNYLLFQILTFQGRIKQDELIVVNYLLFQKSHISITQDVPAWYLDCVECSNFLFRTFNIPKRFKFIFENFMKIIVPYPLLNTLTGRGEGVESRQAGRSFKYSPDFFSGNRKNSGNRPSFRPFRTPSPTHPSTTRMWDKRIFIMY
jgi:hypothetical protein